MSPRHDLANVFCVVSFVFSHEFRVESRPKLMTKKKKAITMVQTIPHNQRHQPNNTTYLQQRISHSRATRPIRWFGELGHVPPMQL
eukprot:scaffold4020_cov112-Skeletonema_marinoi.AAC.2